MQHGRSKPLALSAAGVARAKALCTIQLHIAPPGVERFAAWLALSRERLRQHRKFHRRLMIPRSAELRLFFFTKQYPLDRLLKHFTIVAITIGALTLSIGSICAAGLTGSCCGDLEERIAE